MDNPRPVPPNLRVVEASAWTNGSNSRRACAGSMPMPNYPPSHPEARLAEAEREALAQGLLRTLGRGEEDD